MGYWKTKVLPKIKKVFEKNGTKKAAAEASKSFDDSKEEISKEIEDKKTELQPKVDEIYQASPAEIKAIVKDPKEEGLKKNSAAVQSFLEELVKIEFPGSKAVAEATSKYGVALIPGPVVFLLEKVSTLIVVENEPVVEATSSKEKEIVVEEEKKEEVVVAVAVPEAEVKDEAVAVVEGEPSKVEESAEKEVAAPKA